MLGRPVDDVFELALGRVPLEGVRRKLAFGDFFSFSEAFDPFIGDKGALAVRLPFLVGLVVATKPLIDIPKNNVSGELCKRIEAASDQRRLA